MGSRFLKASARQPLSGEYSSNENVFTGWSNRCGLIIGTGIAFGIPQLTSLSVSRRLKI